jgi:hypothetical protein
MDNTYRSSRHPHFPLISRRAVRTLWKTKTTGQTLPLCIHVMFPSGINHRAHSFIWLVFRVTTLQTKGPVVYFIQAKMIELCLKGYDVINILTGGPTGPLAPMAPCEVVEICVNKTISTFLVRQLIEVWITKSYLSYNNTYYQSHATR